MFQNSIVKFTKLLATQTEILYNDHISSSLTGGEERNGSNQRIDSHRKRRNHQFW